MASKKRRLFKKGTWTMSDILYWFFYIPMTATVIVMLVTIPNGILQTKVETQNIEMDIVMQSVFYKLSYTDPVTGRLYPGIIADDFDLNFFNLTQEDRKVAVKITIDDQKEIFYNKNFFDIARPLAPVRYGLKGNTWVMDDIHGQIHIVEIEQVFTLPGQRYA